MEILSDSEATVQRNFRGSRSTSRSLSPARTKPTSSYLPVMQSEKRNSENKYVKYLNDNLDAKFTRLKFHVSRLPGPCGCRYAWLGYYFFACGFVIHIVCWLTPYEYRCERIFQIYWVFYAGLVIFFHYTKNIRDLEHISVELTLSDNEDSKQVIGYHRADPSQGLACNIGKDESEMKSSKKYVKKFAFLPNRATPISLRSIKEKTASYWEDGAYEPHSHNCQTFALLIYAMFITDNKYEVFHVPCCGEMMQPDISYTDPTESVQRLINTFHILRLSSFIVQMGMYCIIFNRLGVEFSLWTLPVFLFLWTTVYHAAIAVDQYFICRKYERGLQLRELMLAAMCGIHFEVLPYSDQYTFVVSPDNSLQINVSPADSEDGLAGETIPDPKNCEFAKINTRRWRCFGVPTFPICAKVGFILIFWLLQLLILLPVFMNLLFFELISPHRTFPFTGLLVFASLSWVVFFIICCLLYQIPQHCN